jgi:hypothetical protein
MAFRPVDTHDVAMEHYAYSLTGKLGTTGLSPCVAVIILFSDKSVMIEHRSDTELCQHGDDEEAINLLQDIIKNIIKMKKIHINIR